jgi:hypothetical protein
MLHSSPGGATVWKCCAEALRKMVPSTEVTVIAQLPVSSGAKTSTMWAKPDGTSPRLRLHG